MGLNLEVISSGLKPYYCFNQILLLQMLETTDKKTQMKKQQFNNSLILWQEAGSTLIPQNHQIFNNLLSQAKKLANNDQYDAAAVYGQIAANHAQLNHCGFFTSPDLENLLVTIGKKTISSDYSPRKTLAEATPKKILHVSTNIGSIGGISRLMWRWIKQDQERSHSVALTRQVAENLPQGLKDAILASQGQIYLLNEQVGGIITRAKRLRECAADADIVVLHTWEHDVIPTIAFAEREQFPPVIYVNNGDHWFWVGTSICDILANLRESGQVLSHQRRGIESQRNLVLPTILEPISRKISRLEAKQQLGLDPDSILLLSIARSVKYKTVGNVNFAQAHLPLLNKHQNAILMVIGAGNSEEDWSEAIALTQGRIRVLGETKDTATFYQAADIYVDSFPFVSITSLLEAGSYGVPLVSRYPYESDDCGVLGSDMPGLVGNLIRVRSLEEYTQVLAKLAEDREYRLSLGEATKNQIAAHHWGENWQRILEDVYHQAMNVPRQTIIPDGVTEMSLGEPDVFLPSVNHTEIYTVIHWHLSLMPLVQRWRLWLSLVKQYGYQNNPPNYLLSEKLRSHYYSWRSIIFSRFRSWLKGGAYDS
jgi:glycosyltransferase involved in cell wall biosynthesis